MIINQIYNKTKAKTGKQSLSDSQGRSILKAISWRVIGTLDTIIISWFIAGDLSIAFSIGSIELLTKFILYYCHERAWNFIRIGK